MRKETIPSIIVIISIVLVVMLAGCMEDEKVSASDEINMSVSLMSSGSDRIEKIDLEEGAYSNAKAKLAASKVDYEEALKILTNASTDYDEEKKVIETLKIICNYSLDGIAAFQKLMTCREHIDKANAYMKGDDFASCKAELTLAEDALNDASPFISTAKEKCFSIDIDTVHIKLKTDLLEDRLSIEQLEKMISEFGEMISGLNSFVDGCEHLVKAKDYMEKEEWHSAELEFGKCSPNFSKSKDVFMKLKNSELPEVSIPAIEAYGPLTKILDALPHFEAGCRYADRGDYKKAREEFNKIPEI